MQHATRVLVEVWCSECCQTVIGQANAMDPTEIPASDLFETAMASAREEHPGCLGGDRGIFEVKGTGKI